MSARSEDPMVYELLEACLRRIEAGEPRAAVLDALAEEPGTRAELAGLISASMALRDMPLPELPPIDQAAIEADLLAHAAAQGGPAPGSIWRPWLNLVLVGLGLLGAWLLWSGLPSGPELDGDVPAAPGLVEEVADPTAVEHSDPRAEQAVADAAVSDGKPGAAPLESGEKDAGARSAVAPAKSGTPTSPSATTRAIPTPSATLPAFVAAAATVMASPTSSATATASPRPPDRSDPGEDPPKDPEPSQTPHPSATPTPTGTPSATPSLTPSPTYPASATPTVAASKTPEPEAVLEVLVREADGEDPLAGAAVFAEREDGGPTVRGETNADGNARLVLVGDVDYRVRVERDSYRTRWWPDAEDRAGADLVRVAAGGSREILLRLPRQDVSIDRAPVSR